MGNPWAENIEATYSKALSDLITNFQPSSSITPNISQPLYGGVEFPLYGPQYGLPEHVNESDNLKSTQPAVMCALVTDPYEEMIRQADADIQREYLESLKISGCMGVDGQLK